MLEFVSGQEDEVLSFLDEVSAMSDVGMAQSLVRQTWQVRPGRRAKHCIAAIHEAVKRVERKLPIEVLRGRPRRWTERRVTAIWKGEARRVDNYEMVDLEQAALEAARYEHHEAIGRAERLAAFIAAHEKTEAGELSERLRELVG